MDTALNITGDISRDTVSGSDEIQQRLYILLSARYGKFIYDRELGSDIFSVDISQPDCTDIIESHARKALSDMPNAEIIGVVADNGNICIGVEADGEIYEITLRQ